MKVRDIMRTPVVVICRSDTLEQAAKTMLQNNLRGLPVVDDKGVICGFISVSDYLAKNKGFPFTRYSAPHLFGKWVPDEGIEEIYEEARNLTVGQVMSTPALTIKEDASVEELVELMLRLGLNRIPVVRDGVPVGMVARYDLLKMMMHKAVDSPNA